MVSKGRFCRANEFCKTSLGKFLESCYHLYHMQSPKCEIFRTPPKDFSPSVSVSSCYCHCEGRLLLLKRHPGKSQGERWGVPAGKLEEGESPLEGLIREIKEEIGIVLAPKDGAFITTIFIRLPWVDYTYHMFFTSFDEYPALDLAIDEHTECKWATMPEALQLPLIWGAETALEIYQDYLRLLQPMGFKI
jgi:8-oxo-dGTP pyrophosphatase MutT (NUDIX family)